MSAPRLTAERALKEIAAGDGWWVAENLTSFSVLTPDIALALIHAKEGWAVASSPARFGGLTSEVAQALSAAGVIIKFPEVR